VSNIGSSSMRVETAKLSVTEVESVRVALGKAYGVPVNNVTFSFIGPSWGSDVSSKAITALVVFLALLAS